jgi:hypothetical protein
VTGMGVIGPKYDEVRDRGGMDVAVCCLHKNLSLVAQKSQSGPFRERASTPREKVILLC